MILLFTDFGWQGPYLGEVEAVLRRAVPEVPVVNLMSDAPAFRPDLAAYLLAALVPRTLQPGDVLIGVVDPSVGGARQPIALDLDGRWFVGPDNGLFEIALRTATRAVAYRIAWTPPRLSASFHGRDLFAPVAARLARGERRDLVAADVTRFPDRPDDLPVVIYIDRYGNAMTGMRATSITASTMLRCGTAWLAPARTFSDAPPGEPFWYENSSGLVEIAVNGGHAATLLGLSPGTPVILDRS